MTNSRSKVQNIPVVYFHSIGPINQEWKRNFLTLELDSFIEILNYLSENYTTISLRKYWEIRNGLCESVKNPIVITFDDGYLDNWIWAFPELKKLGLKATLFISPEFIDTKNGIRPNLDDYENGRSSMDEITQWGFLSWDELRIMEESGLIDVQSHTMSHSTNFVSDKIIDFHHPGVDILYKICNLFPDIKPYYIGDKNFENLLPYGYPLFEEKSAIVARKVNINEDFINECIQVLRGYNFNSYHFEGAWKRIKPVYQSYKLKDAIVTSRETEEEYIERLKYEIIGSKEKIEEKLDKQVDFLCWPHGYNNIVAHEMAIGTGYLMTTIGKAKQSSKNDLTRISERMGMNYSTIGRRKKSNVKLKAFSGKYPYSNILKLYRQIT